jgi:membrane protease subunit HflK
VARGQAALDLATARAGATSAELEARGRAEAFSAVARAYAGAPALLGDLLWLESAERVLAGRDKLIVPPGSAGRQVAVWQPAPGAASQASPPPNARLAPVPALAPVDQGER